EAGPANLSATIKAYFAMKMAGVALSDPTMVAARELIPEMGGPAKADVFTKILLALFGDYDWSGVPTMPVEIMLLPRPFFLFNIYEISYWSRTVLVPLLVLMDRKPVKWLPPHLSLDELWPVPREETSLRFSRVPEPFSWRGLFWKSFFIAVDDGLKIWERFSPRPLRRRAIETARLWLEDRAADLRRGRLAGEAPARAGRRLGLPVRERLLPGSRRHGDGRDGPREGARARRRCGAHGQGARPRLVSRDAGRRRGLGLLRRRQQPHLSEPHPVRRPRRPARPVDGGSDRTRARAPRHPRVPQGLRAGPARHRFPPPRAATRRPVVRSLGRELHLRHVVGPARARRRRRGSAARVRAARGPLARAPPEPGRRLGRNLRELRRLRVRRRGRLDPESDRLGPAGPLRGRAHERPRGRARRQLSSTESARRRLVGGCVVERDGLPAGLL